MVQPYKRPSQFDLIATAIQTVQIQKKSQINVSIPRQKSAFPPNFIHSLDSTHMMYTALECQKRGIIFAAVHDSYWTHACDIDDMGEILREQFVELHSQPLLENLKQSFEKRFPTIEFPDIPERGKFDLNHVKGSEYFFS